MPTVQENEQKFEEMGLASVRLLISTSGLPPDMISDAKRWAARREEEERQRELASRNEQAQLAREQSRLAREQTQLAVEQKQIARRTLSVTWIAAAAAVLALIVACLAWLFPRV
jgi:Flp pilus assembly protein TadB